MVILYVASGTGGWRKPSPGGPAGWGTFVAITKLSENVMHTANIRFCLLFCNYSRMSHVLFHLTYIKPSNFPEEILAILCTVAWLKSFLEFYSYKTSTEHLERLHCIEEHI